MSDRERAKQIIDDAFGKIRGDIGRLAKLAVPKEDMQAMIDLVEREIASLRAECVSRETTRA